MKDRDFLKRLKKELPQWVAKGWVQSQYEQAILESAAHSAQPKPAHFMLALFGTILILVGVISFFAANWQGISKLGKLFILFSGIILSYGTAGYFYTLKKGRSYFAWLAELLLLFGVGLFGTDIFFISQIYHIDAHFPNGLLIWSLGAWLVSVLMASPLCMLPAIILGFIWSFTESFLFLFSIHWAFLGLFILFLIPIMKFKWKFVLHVLLIGFLIWLTLNLFWLSPESNELKISYELFYTHILILSALILLSLCWIAREKVLSILNRTIEHYSLFYLLFFLFFISFPDLLERMLSKTVGLKYPILFTILTLAFVAGSLFVWNLIKNSKTTLIVKQIGIILSISLPALLLISYFKVAPNFLAILYNILFVGMIAWFTLLGYEKQDRIYINLSFLFFAFFIIARYFDVFWSLLNRSLFFVLGGALLIFGSIVLEKKRRQLTHPLKTDIKRNEM